MNTIYSDIAEALASTSWDDVATGVLGATFCAASATMFALVFIGA